MVAKLFVAGFIAITLSGCGYKVVKDEPVSKPAPQVSIPVLPPLGSELPPAQKPVAKPAPQVVQAQPAQKPICVTTKKVVSVVETPFMSTGCGNLTPQPEDARKGGHIISSGYPFSDCSVDSAKAFLDSYNGPERCRPRVSMAQYGRLLELMGLPVAPNAEGFIKLMNSPNVRAVDCTPEILAKVNMARTTVDGLYYDFGHTRRACYQYGGKVEKILVYRKEITKDETTCTSPPAQKPAPQVVAPAPKPQVSTTPNACPASDRTFRIRVWNERQQEVRNCLAQSDPRWDSSRAFSRNQCIVGLVKGERATGQVRPWHLQSPVTARVAVIDDSGRELERLRDVVLSNGFAEFSEPYAKLAGKRLRVEFVSVAGEFVSPVTSTLGTREVRIAPSEFERSNCGYDISGAVRP